MFLKSPLLYICRAHSCRCRHLFADMLRVRRTRHVNSRHRQRSRCQHHLASHGTAQTCTVVQCDYSHQIRLPLLFSKLPQQSRYRQNRSRHRRLFAGMSPFRRTQPRNITACRSSGYVTEHWSVSGTIFRRALAGAVQWRISVALRHSATDLSAAVAAVSRWRVQQEPVL